MTHRLATVLLSVSAAFSATFVAAADVPGPATLPDSLQPTTPAPAIVQEVAPATQPSAAPATQPAAVDDPTDTRPPALRALMARAATQPTATQPTVRPTTTTARDSRDSRDSRSSNSSRPDEARSGRAPAAKPLPTEFALLTQRSIFIKGRKTTYEPREPTTTLSTQPTTTFVSRPERTLVFDGATDVDGQIVAFVEDTSTNKVLQLKPGDAVASGSITAVNLDSITYASNGKETAVRIGYNLEGLPGTVATSQPSGPLFGSSGSPFGSSGGGYSSGGGGYSRGYDSSRGSGGSYDRGSGGYSRGSSGGDSRGSYGNNNSSGNTGSNGSTSSGGTGANVDDVLAKLRAKRAAEMGGAPR